VAAQHEPWLTAWERELMAGRAWRHEPVDWSAVGWRARALCWRTGLRQKFCWRLAGSGVFREPVAELAFGRLHRELVAAVAREPADLISAHYVAGLAAAGAAARHRVPVAFDAEDDHFGEFPAGEEASLPARLVYHLESKYLPRCVYVTAASEGIADALAERYGIARPTAVHNVFPWAERARCDGAVKDRRGSGLSLTWFSQVVGLSRGLQDVIRAAGLVSGDLQIHVRGRLEDDVRRELERLADECGVRGRLHFHPLTHPDELLARTAEHDVGLALEQPVSRNKAQTCSNKLFFYLLAGLAVVATDVPGQRAVLETCPGAGFLYPPGDYQTLAGHLRRLSEAPEAVQRARRAALAAARERWNWELESQKILSPAKAALSRPRP
jgi:glycosyltransferase involved in cell wall biosynthesis